MNENELLNFIDRNGSNLVRDSYSGSDEYLGDFRKKMFVPNQKLTVLRRWFYVVPNIQLTDDELNIVESIITKSEQSELFLILNIIRGQDTLNDSEIVKWFKYVKPEDRIRGAVSLIKNNKVTDYAFKIELFNELLDSYDYQIAAIDMLEEQRYFQNAIWRKLLDILVEKINENDERSKRLATYWAEATTNLDNEAQKQSIISLPLYNATKRNQYLPKEAKNIFLF